jgi:methylenetetrahydrofolate reductase (NADPH)
MDIMNNSYLVNVVHNNFKDPGAIFVPFLKAGEEYAASHPPQNGSAMTNGVVN